MTTGASTSMPAASLGLAAGLRPAPRPLTPMSPPPSFALLSSAIFICSLDYDSARSLCGEVSDRWGNHALSCGCGGDKILRHNAVRDVVCSAVSEFTSVSPELEKPGLLPPDPGGPDPGICLPPGSPPSPADVWVPRSVSGFAESWVP